MTAVFDDTSALNALVLVPPTYLILSETPMLDEDDYLQAVEDFESVVLAAARFHRNWNETIKSLNLPEDEYHYDSEGGLELPENWEPPVDRSEITSLEYAVGQLYLNMTRANLRRPSLSYLAEFNVLERTVERATEEFSLLLF
ncbi:MAG: hypothetical protein H9W81_18410 [Enterococcus sp.]|nr:hypothetical protein [Enterococcus sp.]